MDSAPVRQGQIVGQRTIWGVGSLGLRTRLTFRKLRNNCNRCLGDWVERVRGAIVIHPCEDAVHVGALGYIGRRTLVVVEGSKETRNPLSLAGDI